MLGFRRPPVEVSRRPARVAVGIFGYSMRASTHRRAHSDTRRDIHHTPHYTLGTTLCHITIMAGPWPWRVATYAYIFIFIHHILVKHHSETIWLGASIQEYCGV
jgi:hypothetical protein